MGLIDEAKQAPPQLAATLESGVNTLSANQSICFQQYSKTVLSDDGTVFWVATGKKADFEGSLHFITDRHQDEDQTVAANRFIFTAEEEVTEFNSINPTTMWIGTWIADGVSLQIAFADRGSFYQQADQWHYSGYAVYPAMSTQIINSAADLPVGPIVSNSLPIWLTQNAMAPVYPSFLVPDNIRPPYIVAHIEPDNTDAIGSFPILGLPGVQQGGGAAPFFDFPSSQLMLDRVTLTMYGFTNQQAIQYYCSLIDYSRNTDDFGFCNSPAIRDAKRTQAEIAAIAMKKTLEIHASYYQGTADALARRYILSAAVTITI
jgi:hypothetical protein